MRAAGRTLIGGCICLAALPAQATIYYSTYTPSDTAVTTTGGQFPTERRLPDASQTFDDYAREQVYQTGYICCTFVQEHAYSEFVAATSFNAAALIVPLRFISSYSGSNIGFILQHYDAGSGTWSDPVASSYATVHDTAIGTDGAIREMELPFGTNATADPTYFTHLPIPVIAGEKYRIISTHASGSIASIRWYESDLAVDYAGQAYQTSQASGQAGNLAHQLAFALTDGGSLAAALPEPASWLSLVTGFGLLGGALRRRRGQAASVA